MLICVFIISIHLSLYRYLLSILYVHINIILFSRDPIQICLRMPSSPHQRTHLSLLSISLSISLIFYDLLSMIIFFYFYKLSISLYTCTYICYSTYIRLILLVFPAFIPAPAANPANLTTSLLDHLHLHSTYSLHRHHSTASLLIDTSTHRHHDSRQYHHINPSPPRRPLATRARLTMGHA